MKVEKNKHIKNISTFDVYLVENWIEVGVEKTENETLREKQQKVYA
jgi:hypothetical protein